MANDGTINVNPSTAAAAVPVDNTLIAGNTYRQRVVIGGDASSSALIEPLTTAPASSAWAMPVRSVTGSTDTYLGRIGISTGAATAFIDPRDRNWTISSGETIGVVAVSTLDVRAVASSSVGFASLLSTAANSSYYDARTRSWTLSTAESVGVVAASTLDVILRGGTSGYLVGNVLLTTGAAGAAIDPRDRNWSLSSGVDEVAIVAGSTLDVRTIGAGSSAVVGTVLSATGLTGAAIDPRQVTLQAASTATLIGTVAVSSAGGGQRDPFYSTGSLGGSQMNFFSTGFAMGATQAMISLNRVTDGVVSSTAITSYTVTTGKNLILDYMTVTLVNTTTANKIASLVIHVTSSGAASTGAPRMWVSRFPLNMGSSGSGLNGGEMWPIDIDMVIPSAYSFGLSGVASSSANDFSIQICAREVAQLP